MTQTRESCSVPTSTSLLIKHRRCARDKNEHDMLKHCRRNYPWPRHLSCHIIFYATVKSVDHFYSGVHFLCSFYDIYLFLIRQYAIFLYFEYKCACTWAKLKVFRSFCKQHVVEEPDSVSFQRCILAYLIFTCLPNLERIPSYTD